MLSFSNTEIAFTAKSDKDLRKTYFLFSMMGKPWLVKLGSILLIWAFKLRLPVKRLVKNTIFSQFAGGESIRDCDSAVENLAQYNVKTVLSLSVEAQEEEEEFEKATLETIATITRAKNDDNIPFAVFKPTSLASFDILERAGGTKPMKAKHQAEFEKVRERFNRICKAAYEADVPVQVDAEESWIQDAIDALTTEMMVQYNREKAIVYNTIQLYRHDRLAYLKKAYEIAEKEGYYLGMKLVRGAYMEKERDRAEEKGYKSPIQPTKVDTDNAYNQAIEFCVERHPRIAIYLGTHNEKSCLHLAELMEKKGIPANDFTMYFAQLYGMSDNISFNLAEAGYNVAKYVPYGPVKEVMPYLVRRAEENTSVQGQTGREFALISKEVQRRKSVS